MLTLSEALAQAKAHHRAGQLQLAEPLYRQVLAADPSHGEAYYLLGALCHALGKLREAAECFEQAVRLSPHDAQAHHYLGVWLAEQGNLDEAAASFRRALSLNPDYIEAYNNLGMVLSYQGKLEEALASHRRALQIREDLAETHYHLGATLNRQGKLDDALTSYGRALELRPDYAEARCDRSVLWLLRGDFAHGWPEYEWRWKTPQLSLPNPGRPLWDGQPAGGKAILLHWEQGLGDTIQFIRYAALVKQLGAEVIVGCQKPLLRLLASCPGIDHLVGEGESPPEFAAYAPLLSLPRIFKTSLATIPARIPYLFAAPPLVEQWRRRLSSVAGFKIGINWQGRVRSSENIPMPPDPRNIRLAQFAPLARVSGVRLVSLQKGAGSEQLAEARDLLSIVDWTDELDEAAGPLMDTAAMMMSLDLIVTSDTAVAHLAGALGVPVWVALPFVPDWRWLLDRDDSPWYPTMRLFRQKKPGDWQGVFDDIKTALCQRIASCY